MAFCGKCGQEVPVGNRFCPNCGAPVGANTNNDERSAEMAELKEMTKNAPVYSDRTQAEIPKQEKSRITKFIGIGLLILAVIDFFTDPPVLTIALSVMIIIGCIVCLLKRFRLKGFTIAALVVACLCIGAAVYQGVEYGWLVTPDSAESSGSRKVDPKYANVDPDLKKFLDSYEDFVDEYVDFMKKYLADPMNVLSMLSEYNDIMAKYDDFSKKIDQYDSGKMSSLDAQYYLEVTTRCTQKMLDIYR